MEVNRDPSLADTRRRRFEAIFSGVYEPIQRYVRRRVEAGAVDDIVSETMSTIWRRLDDVPAAALPWAYRVARWHIANHRRAGRRHLRLVQRAEHERGAATDSAHPLDAELHSALSAMGDSDREILRLWAWEQLEPAEIAVVLGLTPNAVSIRLNRAKKKLKENLEVTRKDDAFSGHSHRENTEEERI